MADYTDAVNIPISFTVTEKSVDIDSLISGIKSKFEGLAKNVNHTLSNIGSRTNMTHTVQGINRITVAVNTLEASLQRVMGLLQSLENSDAISQISGLQTSSMQVQQINTNLETSIKLITDVAKSMAFLNKQSVYVSGSIQKIAKTLNRIELGMYNTDDTQPEEKTKKSFGEITTMLTKSLFKIKMIVGAIEMVLRGIAGALNKYIVEPVKKTLQIVIVAGNKIKAIFEKLISVITRAGSALLSFAKNAVSKVANSLTSITKNSISFSGIIDNLEKKFKKISKFITQFVFGFRSTYFLIKRLRTTFIDAFKALALQNEEVNKQISELMTNFNQIKGSIITAFEPIVTYVLPIFNKLLNKLAEVMSAFGTFMAQLTGQGYIYKYTAKQIDYAAEALKDTDEEAKKLEKTLASFDTLDILGKPDKATSEKDKTEDWGTWEKVAVKNNNSLIKKLKAAWKKADFTAIAESFGNKVKALLDDITEALNGKVSAFLTKLSSSLYTGFNGIFRNLDLANSLGTTLGTALNTAISSINQFLKNADWTAFGKFISTSLNSFFQTANFEEIGETIANYIQKGVDSWYGFITTFDFSELGTKINESIQAFFDDMGEVDKKTGKSGWEKLGYNIGASFKGLADVLKGVFTKENLQNIRQSIADIITGIKGGIGWDDINWDFSNMWASLVNGIVNTVNNIPWTEAADKVNKFFITQEELLWQPEDPTGINRRIEHAPFAKILTGLTDMVVSVINGILDFVEAFNWEEFFLTVFKVIAKCISKLTENGTVKRLFDAAVNIIKSLLTVIYTELRKQDWDVFAENIANAIEGELGVITELTKLLVDINNELFDACLKIIEKLPWKKIGDAIGKGLGGLDWGTIFFRALEIKSSIILGAIQAWIGSKLGVNLPTPGKGSGQSNSFSSAVPGLATGAVLPANRPFLAMVGDQRSGTNIEAPLSTIEEAVRNVMAEQEYNFNVEAKGSMGALIRALNLQIKRENGRASAF